MNTPMSPGHLAIRWLAQVRSGMKENLALSSAPAVVDGAAHITEEVRFGA
jgi:hypothetical protein